MKIMGKIIYVGIFLSLQFVLFTQPLYLLNNRNLWENRKFGLMIEFFTIIIVVAICSLIMGLTKSKWKPLIPAAIILTSNITIPLYAHESPEFISMLVSTSVALLLLGILIRKIIELIKKRSI